MSLYALFNLLREVDHCALPAADCRTLRARFERAICERMQLDQQR